MTGSGGAGPAVLPPGPMTEIEFRSLYERLRGSCHGDRMTGAGR